MANGTFCCQVDGSLTLGENIADSAGIKLAFRVCFSVIVLVISFIDFVHVSSILAFSFISLVFFLISLVLCFIVLVIYFFFDLTYVVVFV